MWSLDHLAQLFALFIDLISTRGRCYERKGVILSEPERLQPTATSQSAIRFPDKWKSIRMSNQFEVIVAATAAQGAVSVFGLKERLLKTILDKLQEYRTTGLKLPPKDQFLAACKAAYEKYVVAFDIPQLPDFIEIPLDEALESAFMRLVETLYDRFAARS